MTQTLILQTLQDLIDLGVAVLVPIAINFLLSRISKTNLEKYKVLAQSVVQATEMTMGAGNGSLKKEAAEKKLSTLTKGKLSVDEIDHLLENAVYEMKKDAQAVIDNAPTPTPVSTPVATDTPSPTATN